MENKKEMSYLIGKRVKVVLKNGWKYEGEFLENFGECIVVADWKDGNTTIDIPSISAISEV
jgi:hypothetical protein